jgi:hydroxymethylglutaryl-CoA reductase
VPGASKKPSLYACLTLPSLMVSMPHHKGVAGTNLPSQRANVDMIGAETPEEMACVLAATLLGGELSYYAAVGMHFLSKSESMKIRAEEEEDEYKFNV